MESAHIRALRPGGSAGAYPATAGMAMRTLAVLVAVLAAMACALAVCPHAHAASGTVYSCTVVPCYKHPKTGEIEDAGGKSAQATGQAMAESCLSGKGMFEVTDSGKYYLTIRLSLVDFTRDQAFQVQEWGSGAWSDPKLGVTATGKDSNGTTNDVCIQVPSQKCVVRVSMFVESMGRNVVFYCYPKGFKEGTPKGFTATRVTSGSTGSSAKNGAAGGASQGGDSKEAAEAQEKKGAQAGEEGSESSSGADEEPSDLEEVEADEGAASTAEDLVEGSVTSNAQGLSLSTAAGTDSQASSGEDGTAGAGPEAASASPGVAETALALMVAIVGSGLVLMAVAVGIVYYFRRNWARWGGSDPDDYSGLYGDEDE